MADSNEKANIEKAVSLAKQATEFDSNGSYTAAVYYYREAALLLAEVKGQSSSLVDKIKQYLDRADQLELQEQQKNEGQFNKL